jgi:hypothetical protein
MSPPLQPFDDGSVDGTAAAQKEYPLMVHDLVLALVFLGMILAPALLAMRSGKEEKDSF